MNKISGLGDFVCDFTSNSCLFECHIYIFNEPIHNLCKYVWASLEIKPLGLKELPYKQ